VKTYAGEFATSLEMAGFSISICKLDEELKTLLGASADSPFFSADQGGSMITMAVAKEILQTISDLMAENRDYLIDLDSQMGDGDLG
jgi:hypothetical protein